MAPDYMYCADNPTEGHINGSRNSKFSVIVSNLGSCPRSSVSLLLHHELAADCNETICGL